MSKYCKADNCLCGKVLGLTKDCITYEGNTIVELKTDFEDAIDSYMEGCKELGIEPRKAYKGVLNIRISPEIHSRIAIITDETGTSINAVIREAIEQNLAVAH